MGSMAIIIFIIFSVQGPFLESKIYRRQILTSKDVRF